MCILDCHGQKQTKCVLFGEKQAVEHQQKIVETIRLILVTMIIQLANSDIKSL